MRYRKGNPTGNVSLTLAVPPLTSQYLPANSASYWSQKGTGLTKWWQASETGQSPTGLFSPLISGWKPKNYILYHSKMRRRKASEKHNACPPAQTGKTMTPCTVANAEQFQSYEMLSRIWFRVLTIMRVLEMVSIVFYWKPAYAA